MDREELIRTASREAAMVILFNGITTKGDIALASDLIAKRILDTVEPVIRDSFLDELAAEDGARKILAKARSQTIAQIRESAVDCQMPLPAVAAYDRLDGIEKHRTREWCEGWDAGYANAVLNVRVSIDEVERRQSPPVP